MDFQSLVEIAPWTFIAQICNLLIQAALFKKFLFNPVKKIIQERQAQVNKIYDSAAEAEQSAKADKETYEKLLADAKGEAAELVRTATATAQQRGDEIIRQARQEAGAMKEKAQADIEQERKKALNEAKDEISGIAMEIATQVVGKEIRAQDHQALVEEFIEKIGEDA